MLVSEVAMTLGMTRAGVRALERRGLLTAVRSLGGWRVFLSDEVMALQKSRARRANARQRIRSR